MSNLLFGIAGAAIGSAFGMPALGFALGSGVGAAFGGHHHAASPVFPGVRLNDLKVQTSTYGIGIPRIYGIYRLAGNVIWATDVVEVKDSAGHYSYYGNFAIGLCAGPMVGIRRIWADGKEIFKVERSASGEEGLRIHYPPHLRFYPGDETQHPDFLLEAHQGKGKTPAFRGLAYIVFEHLPLANFNNRLPNITVEVVQSVIAVSDTAEDSSTEKTRVQDGIHCHVKRHSTYQPKPAGKKDLPSAVPLPQIIQNLCSTIEWLTDRIDTTLLTVSVTGFVLSQPTSLREALGLLQQAYGFDVVESGTQFKCLPRGLLPPLPVPSDALVIEEDADRAESTLTRLSDVELPQQVTVFFTEAGKEYRLATQTAQRADGMGHAGERIELPLVLRFDEAAHMAESLLAERSRSRTLISFSLSRAYAALEPGDRITLHCGLWRVLSTAYGSPGLIKIQAVEEALPYADY